MIFSVCFLDKKSSVTQRMTELWQREKDSNPHKQSQSLSCYPYTIPLSFVFLRPATHEHRIYYSKEAEIVKGFSKIF